MKKKIRNFIKKILQLIIVLLPFKWLQRKYKNKLIIINYHSIKNKDTDKIVNKKGKYRTEKEFEDDIIFLKKHYNFISNKDFLNCIKNKKPFPEKSVLLTFDDGLHTVYEYMFPIMKKHNVNGLVFINPCFIDNKDMHHGRKVNFILNSITNDDINKYENKWRKIFNSVGINNASFFESINSINIKTSVILDDLISLFKINIKNYLHANKIYMYNSQISEMLKSGFYFGGHSMTHPEYEYLNNNEQVSQSIDSVDWVQNNYNLNYRLFAFPRNDKNIKIQVFDELMKSVDASFGVNGMSEDQITNHFHRIDLESSNLSAANALKFNYLIYFFEVITGKTPFKRKS